MKPARFVALLLRRLATGLITIVGVTLVTYLVLAELPGDPLAALTPIDQRMALSVDQRAQLRAELGLDRPVLMRYARWAGRLLGGDFGRSVRTRRPVFTEIRRRLRPTIELSVASLLLVTCIGLPLGWILAKRAGSRADTATSSLLLVLYALPSFWVAIVLQNLLAVSWGLLPLYGRTPAGGDPGLWGRLPFLILPAACLGLHQLAFYTRFARNTALDGINSVHALFARACGLREGRVMLTHGVWPSLVPLATLIGLILPSLVTGSILIETIFSWPGLGRLFYQAVLSRDTPVVLGMTVIIASLTIVGSLVSDLLASTLDPRQRRGKEAEL